MKHEADSVTDLGTPAQEGRLVARAAGKLGLLTALSRLLGVARDIAQAAFLGTGTAADAFTIAFILPNILRRVFGESTVSAAFVPTYTETLVRAEDPEAAARLARRVLTAAALVLVPVVVAGIAAAPLLIRVFVPGFSAVAGKAELATGLLRLLFPYILFVGLASIVMGILNSHRHFTTPALGPVLFNLCALGGLMLLGRLAFPARPVWGYSIGVGLGGMAQLVVQLPVLSRKGVAYWKPLAGFSDPAFRKIVRLMVPAVIGLAAAEVNIMVDQMIASMLSPGSVSALLYGSRITQFPLGIFAVALATALLPTLSRQTALGRTDEARRTLRSATIGLFLIMTPALVFTAVLAEPIVTILLARGLFTARSVSLTGTALLFYSFGLIASGGVKITAPVFYAMKDTRTPVKIAIGCMGLNIVLNGLFTILFIRTRIAPALGGLALASSVSSTVNFVLLRSVLSRRLGRGGPGGLSSARPWLAMLAGGGLSILLLLLGVPVLRRIVAGGSVLAALGALACMAVVTFVVFLAPVRVIGGAETGALLRMLVGRHGDGST